MMDVKAAYDAEKKTQNLTDFIAVKDRYERWMGRIRHLSSVLQRYKRRTMRYYIKRVNAFLLAPNVLRRRSVKKLRIQSFRMSSYIDRWIAAAIDGCGVEDLELDFKGFGCHLYDFRLLDGSRNVQLKRLVLSRCFHRLAFDSLLFHRLTELTLCKILDLGSVCDVLTNCVQLVDFRLKHSCVYYAVLRIDAAASKLKRLQVENCKIGKLFLHSLPCLETFVCQGQPTKLYYGEVPQLRDASLNFLQIGDKGRITSFSSSSDYKMLLDCEEDSSSSKMTYPLRKFFKGMPPLEHLVLQLKGPQMWIEPTAIPSLFSHLRKLFIANVPMYWDIFWIFILLDAAPSLESLHVHIDSTECNSEKMGVGLDVQGEHEYHLLKELVVIGFNGVSWQTCVVKQIMRASPRLMHIHLLDGHVVEDDKEELGSLKLVPHRREWEECERLEVLDDLVDGLSLQNWEIILE